MGSSCLLHTAETLKGSGMSTKHQIQSLITLFSLLLILGLTIAGLDYINSRCRVGCQSQKDNGKNYHGTAHRTKEGDTCLNWMTHAANAPEWVDHTDHTYDHNHCRNPTRIPAKVALKESVWCYTGLGNTWDYCDVPWCLKPGQASMNTTVVEKEGERFIITVIIILIVVTWCRNTKEEENTVELISNSDSGICSS